MPKFFRVNKIAANSETEVISELKSLGFTVDPSNLDGCFFAHNEETHLSDTETYKSGKIYIQNISSQVPVKFLNLNTSENHIHLDISASPGSKTTQSASEMRNTGLIIANEPVKTRIQKLAQNLDLQKVTNTIVLSLRGETMNTFFNNLFDTAVVDPPCSSLGRDPNVKWYPKKSKILSILQLNLLKSAFLTLKNGGELVYSTCTTQMEENEKVIFSFLKQFSDKCQLIDLNPKLKSIFSGNLEEFVEQKNSDKIPDEIFEKTLNLKGLGEGFFIAKIRKTDETFSKFAPKKIRGTIEMISKNEDFVEMRFNSRYAKIPKNIWTKIKGYFYES